MRFSRSPGALKVKRLVGTMVSVGVLALLLGIGGSAQAATPTASPLPAPTGLSATAQGDGIVLGWNTDGDATSYAVSVTPPSVTVDNTVTTVDTSGCTSSTSCSVTGLVAGTEYSFSVTATDANGTSAPSSPVTATPDDTGGYSAPNALSGPSDLPMLRWAGAIGTLSFNYGLSDLSNPGEPVFTVFGEVLYKAAGVCWELIGWMVEEAAGAGSIVNTMGNEVNYVYGALGLGFMGGSGTDSLLMTVGAIGLGIVLYKAWRRHAGLVGVLKGALGVVLPMVLLVVTMNAAITATDNNDTSVVGSPSWAVLSADGALRSLANAVDEPVDALAQNLNTKAQQTKDGGPQALTCAQYEDGLYYEYEGAASSAGPTDLPWESLSNVTLSQIFDSAVVVPWSNGQFGDTPSGNQVYCHLLEVYAGVPAYWQGMAMSYDTPAAEGMTGPEVGHPTWSEFYALMGGAATNPSPASGEIGISAWTLALGPSYTGGDDEMRRTMIAWATCDYVGPQDPADLANPTANGNAQFAIDPNFQYIWVDPPKQSSTATKKNTCYDSGSQSDSSWLPADNTEPPPQNGKSVLSILQKLWSSDSSIVSGELKSLVDPFASIGGAKNVAKGFQTLFSSATESSGPFQFSNLTSIVAATEMNGHDSVNAQGFILGLNGHEAGDAFVMGLLALITSIIYIWVLGGLALGVLLGQLSLVILLALAPILMLLWMVPAQTTRAGARKGFGYLAAAIASVFVFELIMNLLLCTIKIIQIVATGFLGNGGFFGGLLQALIPLASLFLVKRLLKVVGMDSITSLRGAVKATSAFGKMGTQLGGSQYNAKYEHSPLGRHIENFKRTAIKGFEGRFGSNIENRLPTILGGKNQDLTNRMKYMANMSMPWNHKAHELVKASEKTQQQELKSWAAEKLALDSDPNGGKSPRDIRAKSLVEARRKAADPTTTNSELRGLLSHPDIKVQAAASANPNLSKADAKAYADRLDSQQLGTKPKKGLWKGNRELVEFASHTDDQNVLLGLLSDPDEAVASAAWANRALARETGLVGVKYNDRPSLLEGVLKGSADNVVLDAAYEKTEKMLQSVRGQDFDVHGYMDNKGHLLRRVSMSTDKGFLRKIIKRGDNADTYYRGDPEAAELAKSTGRAAYERMLVLKPKPQAAAGPDKPKPTDTDPTDADPTEPVFTGAPAAPGGPNPSGGPDASPKTKAKSKGAGAKPTGPQRTAAARDRSHSYPFGFEVDSKGVAAPLNTMSEAEQKAWDDQREAARRDKGADFVVDSNGHATSIDEDGWYHDGEQDWQENSGSAGPTEPQVGPFAQPGPTSPGPVAGPVGHQPGPAGQPPASDIMWDQVRNYRANSAAWSGEVGADAEEERLAGLSDDEYFQELRENWTKDGAEQRSRAGEVDEQVEVERLNNLSAEEFWAEQEEDYWGGWAGPSATSEPAAPEATTTPGAAAGTAGPPTSAPGPVWTNPVAAKADPTKAAEQPEPSGPAEGAASKPKSTATRTDQAREKKAKKKNNDKGTRPQGKGRSAEKKEEKRARRELDRDPRRKAPRFRENNTRYEIWLAEKALAKGMKDARDEIVRDRTTLLPPFGRRKSFKAIHREPFSGFAKVPKG